MAPMERHVQSARQLAVDANKSHTPRQGNYRRCPGFPSVDPCEYHFQWQSRVI